MTQRNLDGIYMRVHRDGKWQNICLSDMTSKELHDAIKDKDELWLRRAVHELAMTLQVIGCKFGLYVEDE